MRMPCSHLCVVVRGAPRREEAPPRTARGRPSREAAASVATPPRRATPEGHTEGAIRGQGGVHVSPGQGVHSRSGGGACLCWTLRCVRGREG
eukprot:6987472-Pyramimonas_sp.AAC.1